MRTILKKPAINHEDLDLSLSREEKIQRPNIDHLIKRIMTERRLERKTNIATMVLILFAVAIIALVLTQA
tara:strand:+ start:711 stop:920 length:210 start_codon:yes stop_codon:yes gene_type:complete